MSSRDFKELSDVGIKITLKNVHVLYFIVLIQLLKDMDHTIFINTITSHHGATSGKKEHNESPYILLATFLIIYKSG